MSAYTTPVTVLFEAQRSAIEQSQRATEQAVQFQNQLNHIALSGLKSQESVQRQGVELLQAGTHSYLSTVDAMTPGARTSTAQLRRRTDEAFEQLKHNHADLFESVEHEAEQGLDSYEELSAEYLDALDEQLDVLLDAHEDIQSQSVEALEELEARTEEFGERFEDDLDESMDRAEEMQARIEEQIEEQTEQAEQFQGQLESQLDEMQTELDRQAAQMQRSAESIEIESESNGEMSPAGDGDEAESTLDVETVDGIGPSYAEDLRAEGIETVDDLATADAGTVAEATGVSEERAEEWIEETGTETLEGIGTTYTDRLADAGIETMADLNAAGAETVAEAADVSEDQAETWIEQSEN